MTFVCNYKSMEFIFSNITVARMESQIMEKMWLVYFLYFCGFFFFLHLVELESSYKQYNKLYKSIKYPAMLFLYTISINPQWLDCSL